MRYQLQGRPPLEPRMSMPKELVGPVEQRLGPTHQRPHRRARVGRRKSIRGLSTAAAYRPRGEHAPDRDRGGRWQGQGVRGQRAWERRLRHGFGITRSAWPPGRPRVGPPAANRPAPPAPAASLEGQVPPDRPAPAGCQAIAVSCLRPFADQGRALPSPAKTRWLKPPLASTAATWGAGFLSRRQPPCCSASVAASTKIWTLDGSARPRCRRSTTTSRFPCPPMRSPNRCAKPGAVSAWRSP